MKHHPLSAQFIVRYYTVLAAAFTAHNIGHLKLGKKKILRHSENIIIIIIIIIINVVAIC
jgi:hypothetical protein